MDVRSKMAKLKDNIQDLGAEKALKIATDLLQAISRVFSVHIDWSINQMCKQKKDETVADFIQ